jgi:hypothetical protein
MQTVLKAIGVLAGFAWLAFLVICLIGLSRTNAMDNAYATLVPMMGHAFDSDTWKEHWISFNACILVIAALGSLGGLQIMLGKRSGFLLMAASSLLWFALVTAVRLLHIARFDYERVGLIGRLELLGICVAFLLLFQLSRSTPRVTAGA